MILTIWLSTAMFSADAVPRLSDGFIQLDDGTMKLTRQDWQAFPGKMAVIKLGGVPHEF